jgi:hypothetical protein
MRDERPERERYQRASLDDQVRDEIANLRRQPRLLILLAVLVGGFVVLRLLEPAVVQVEDLKVGDCIYIPVPGGGDVGSTRPIGSPVDVVYGLLQAGAERAPCDGSHSHEVAAVFRLDDPASTGYPGTGVLTGREGPACAAAFASYVGHPPEGSVFELTIAVPRDADWATGRRSGVCLVSRADGTFMSQRAGGSGE